jgi:threonine/homoserine/homoserine lactone efflux protein
MGDLGILHPGAFVIAGLLLNLTPGPDLLFVAARAGQAGHRAAWVATLGISAGCLVHVSLGALGVAALLAASPRAYAALEIAGAAWLVWLGLQMLLARRAPDRAPTPFPPRVAAPVQAGRAGSLARIFRDGLLTNVTNPKVALFFLAFVPQFIAPQAGRPGLAFALLGAIFVFNGTLVTGLLGSFVASAAGGLRAARSPRLTHAVARAAALLPRAIGVAFVAIGLRLALTHR